MSRHARDIAVLAAIFVLVVVATGGKADVIWGGIAGCRLNGIAGIARMFADFCRNRCRGFCRMCWMARVVDFSRVRVVVGAGVV